MKPWRVTVVDGRHRRYAGVGVVMATSENEARAVMAEYLKNDSAHGISYVVSEVELHASDEPYVAFFNWGELPVGWPRPHDTPDPER